jgi:peptidoglycan hydrolase CwlO-like protein
MNGSMLVLFAIVATNVIAESENIEQIITRLQNLEQIVQEDRVIINQQQLTIQNLESEIDRLNRKVKENSSGMIS